MVLAKLVNLAQELVFRRVNRGNGIREGELEHDARGEYLEDMADAAAETDALVAGEEEEGAFAGRDVLVPLDEEAHCVEGVEDVFGGVHDAGVGAVGEGAAEFEF